MINPGGIPLIPGDMDALAKDASDLTVVGGDFASTGQQVNATWQGLGGVYRAPEVGELLAATAPVQSVSSSVGADIAAVGSALGAYAADVRQIKARLAQLRTEAQDLANSVNGDDDWRKDQDKVDKNNNLVNAVSDEMAAFFEAQRRCANAINALYGGTQYRAVTGDQPADGEYGYTADQLREATAAGADLPWGTPEEHDEGFWGGVKHFFGGVGDGFTDMVKGLGGLIGWGENGWSWSNAGSAWGGLGTFALAIGAYSVVPGLAVADQTVGVPGFKRGELGQTLVDAGKGLVAWDDWSKDPARAGGKATFNIVTAVVGTKGAGAALRGVGAAAEGSRLATLARAGTLLVRAGETIGELPTVTDLAVNAGRKFSAIFDTVKGVMHFDQTPTVDLPPAHINEPAPHPHLTEHTPHPEPGTVGDNLGHSAPHDTHTSAGEHPDIDDQPATTDHIADGDLGSDHPASGHIAGEGDNVLGNQPDGSWDGAEFGQPLHLSPEANQAAQHLMETAAGNEPRITESLQQIEHDLQSQVPDAHLEGMDYRLKSEDSLKRKLATALSQFPDLRPGEALAGMRDAVRYTYQIPSQEYAHAAGQVYHQLSADGFQKITWRNTWDGTGYRGINSTWLDPKTGQAFEVQFHTPESLAAKELTHSLYDKWRVPGISPAEKMALRQQLDETFATLDTPPGASGLEF